MDVRAGPPADETLDGTSRRILLEVLRRGPVSRAELARRLDLSTASLTRLTKPMVALGLLVEGAAEPPSGSGRPSRPLDVAARRSLFLGVKLVGGAVFAVVTDVRGAVLAHRHRTLDDHTVDAVLAEVGLVTAELRRAYPGVVAAGVAVGGAVDPTGRVRAVPALDWTDVDLGGRLEDGSGLPTVVVNDAFAFVQAEHWFGVGRGADPFLVVTVGFGVGCFVVVHDLLLSGRHGLAGAVLHLPIDPDGPRCPDGHRGCPEVTLTTHALLAAVGRAVGHRVTEDQLRRLVAADDPATLRVLGRWGRTLGRLVAVGANLVDPERVVVSGEAADLVGAVRPEFDAGLAELRRPGSTDEVAVTPLEFYSWARGAAVAAVQRWVLGS
jgi:predicted NBD/HSP70 family sugar kinase